MKIFFTSDLHLNHTNILKYEERPFKNVLEMNEEYIKRWNKKVSKDDTVYVLGDFCFVNNIKDTEDFLSRLNGHKILIKGNHDHHNVYKAKGWDKVVDYYELTINDNLVCLFHYPIAVWNRKHHGSIHLYGHIHSNKLDHHPMTYDLGRAYNIGVDIFGEPVTLDEILKYYEG